MNINIVVIDIDINNLYLSKNKFIHTINNSSRLFKNNCGTCITYI